MQNIQKSTISNVCIENKFTWSSQSIQKMLQNMENGASRTACNWINFDFHEMKWDCWHCTKRRVELNFIHTHTHLMWATNSMWMNFYVEIKIEWSHWRKRPNLMIKRHLAVNPVGKSNDTIESDFNRISMTTAPTNCWRSWIDFYYFDVIFDHMKCMLHVWSKYWIGISNCFGRKTVCLNFKME